MFKSVYHEACFYFSPFSGFLECVSTLLWRKHLHGLFNGCPRLWQISSCRASTSGVEVPMTISAFPPAVHSISCTRILTPPHSSSYTNLPGYTVIHFSGRFHSITCTHGLETAEQGSLWDISWSQGSEALSCCLAPTVGTLPSKMLYQSASPLISEDNELEVTLSMIHVIFITEKKQNTLSRVWWNKLDPTSEHYSV